jgi:hypothetical protein
MTVLICEREPWLDAPRDQNEEADYVGRKNWLDRNAWYAAGLRQGSAHAIVILEQSFRTLTAVSSYGTVINECSPHPVESLCKEAIARGGSQVSACRRFEKFECFIAARVAAELISGECQGTRFFDEEEFFAPAMND